MSKDISEVTVRLAVLQTWFGFLNGVNESFAKSGQPPWIPGSDNKSWQVVDDLAYWVLTGEPYEDSNLLNNGTSSGSEVPVEE